MPRLFFRDIDSGPKTGGKDNKGVWVTVYGVGFGASQGMSTMTIGGGAVDNCPIWGEDWLWYQKITCQLGASVATGNIVVTTSGGSSNALTFTVRSGNIYFVDPAGDNGDDGSFASPWQTIQFAKNTIANGDTVYLREGDYTNLDSADGASSMVMTGHSGASGSPKAMVGYPGEHAHISCDHGGSTCYGISARGGAAAWWTFANFELGDGSLGQTYQIDWDNGSGGDGLRFVGLDTHGSNSVQIVLQGPMNPSSVLGNHIYDYWRLAPNSGGLNERGYGIYYGGYGTQQNINVAYNRIENTQGVGRAGFVDTAGTAITWTSGVKFDSSMIGQGILFPDVGGFVITAVADDEHLTIGESAGNNTGIQYYAGGVQTKGLQIYAHASGDHFRNVSIFSNEILNNCMEGIAAGGGDPGEASWEEAYPLYIYNNVIAGNGSCQYIKDQVYAGMQLGDGFGGMFAKVWNNSFYLNAGGTLGDKGGDIYWSSCDAAFMNPCGLDISNDIFYAQPDGEHYDDYVYERDPLDANNEMTGAKNIFFANTRTGISPPSWVTSTVSTSDPQYVDPQIFSDTYDFGIESGSPAKSGGATLTRGTTDQYGIVRPQNITWAVGSRELDEGVPPPSAVHFPGHQ